MLHMGSLLDFVHHRQGFLGGLGQIAIAIDHIEHVQAVGILRECLCIAAQCGCACIVSTHVHDQVARIGCDPLQIKIQNRNVHVAVCVIRRDHGDTVLGKKPAEIRSAEIGIDDIQIHDADRLPGTGSLQRQIYGIIGFTGAVMPGYNGDFFHITHVHPLDAASRRQVSSGCRPDAHFLR